MICDLDAREVVPVVAPSGSEEVMTRIRELGIALAAEIRSLGSSFETSRARRLAEEAVVWAAKHSA